MPEMGEPDWPPVSIFRNKKVARTGIVPWVRKFILRLKRVRIAEEETLFRSLGVFPGAGGTEGSPDGRYALNKTGDGSCCDFPVRLWEAVNNGS